MDVPLYYWRITQMEQHGKEGKAKASRRKDEENEMDSWRPIISYGNAAAGAIVAVAVANTAAAVCWGDAATGNQIGHGA